MNTTFIIPIRVESPDRERNLKACVRYLLKNTDGKIILKEASTRSVVPEILQEEIHNPRIKYLFEENSGAFHRTKYLNDMLTLVDTPIVSNYDVDVLLPAISYKMAEHAILRDGADVVYPYPESEDAQIRLTFSHEAETLFLAEPILESIHNCQIQYWRAHAGFCFMAKKESYISAGAEFEGFISYGPEDVERLERFHKMGLNVLRLNMKVIHMEHSRTPDSDLRNPYTEFNWRVYETLRSMEAIGIAEYLNSLNYVSSRGWKVESKN